ncbi:MAG: ATP synthase F1 subunit epsilon [Anaerolineales bacterium]|nr:ATP synthase F1 subunit epsilon [Anaerolineales bacterium]
MTIHCEIVSQDRIVFQGDVDIVVLPGTDGEMGILPNHTPLLTTLNFGLIRVRQKGQEEVFTVAGGVAEVQPTIVTVLADAAENVAEIDVKRAEAARERAVKAMEEKSRDEQDSYLAIEAALRRSNLRLDAARRYRRSAQRPSRLGETDKGD